MKKYLLGIIVSFTIGFSVYPVIEILYKGHTHISMAFAGGICMILIFMTDCAMESCSMISKAVASALAVTVTEFVFGVVLNVFLSMGVWDYSDMPANIMGQVCVRYFFVWLLLSFAALRVCRMIRKIAERPKIFRNS